MKQRIAILAVLLTVIGGYLWWQGRPADGSILYGNVDIRDVNLAFRVGGRGSEVLGDEGDVIEAGQPLARLDPLPIAHERDSDRILAIRTFAAQGGVSNIGISLEE